MLKYIPRDTATYDMRPEGLFFTPTRSIGRRTSFKKSRFRLHPRPGDIMVGNNCNITARDSFGTNTNGWSPPFSASRSTTLAAPVDTHHSTVKQTSRPSLPPYQVGLYQSVFRCNVRTRSAFAEEKTLKPGVFCFALNALLATPVDTTHYTAHR